MTEDKRHINYPGNSMLPIISTGPEFTQSKHPKATAAQLKRDSKKRKNKLFLKLRRKNKNRK